MGSYLDTYESGIYGENPGVGGSVTVNSGTDWMDQYHREQMEYDKIQKMGSSRGGGYGSSGNKSSSQVSRLRFTESMPDAPDLPTLTLPKQDKRKIRALTQQIAAPGIRELREKMGSAMNVASDNPNVRRMTLREALQGYGTGLERALSGASGQARAESAQELNRESQEAQLNWQAQTQSMMTAYQNAFNRYMQSAERVTESSSSENGGVPMVTRRNAWGTPEVGPAYGYSPREIAAFGAPNR